MGSNTGDAWDPGRSGSNTGDGWDPGHSGSNTGDGWDPSMSPSQQYSMTEQQPPVEPALPPTSIEEIIANMQLEAARAFRNKVNDPRVLEDIYKSLPATKMSQEDRAAFTSEYTEIKGRVYSVGIEQANRAAGQNLDEMVSRGVMSQESADKQRIKNDAAVNTVLKVYNKKLDAARIGLARDQFNSKSGLGMYGASVIADVDSRNSSIYKGVISQALNNLERKRSAEYNYASDAANAAIRNKTSESNTNIDFGNTMAEAFAPSAGKALKKLIS